MSSADFGETNDAKMWMTAVPTAPGRCRCLWWLVVLPALRRLLQAPAEGMQYWGWGSMLLYTCSVKGVQIVLLKKTIEKLEGQPCPLLCAIFTYEVDNDSGVRKVCISACPIAMQGCKECLLGTSSLKG